MDAFLDWKKFHRIKTFPLPGISAALESVYDSAVDPVLDPTLEYCANAPAEMCYTDKGNKHHIYHPAESGALKVIFIPRTLAVPPESFRRLVFRRNRNKQNQSQWMAVARKSEEHCFGFSVFNADRRFIGGSADYVSLAFPGKSGGFEDVYLKVKDGTGYLYLKVTAVPKGRNVVVEASRVDKKEAPHQLQNIG